MTKIRIHPTKSIADGIPFDDIEGLPPEKCVLLASRGVVFATEFRANGRTYGGTIIATSLDQAEEIAFGRGLNEKIIGNFVGLG